MSWQKKSMILKRVSALFAAIFFSVNSCAVSAEKPESTPALLKQGKALYGKQCAVCHGSGGAGDGKAAFLLYPKPRNFNLNEFRLISTTNMQATDEDLFKTISRGMPGSSMPSWVHLSEKERWALVYVVRSFSEIKSSEELIQAQSETAVTEEGLKRGRELFVKACAACHGLEGKGDGQQMMQDSQGVPLKPRDLTAGIFKGSSSSEDIYYRMVAGIPGSPMPGYQGVFTDEQIWDLIHYTQTLPKPGAEARSHVQQTKITARKLPKIDTDPLSSFWSEIPPMFVALTPLWWRNDRIEGVDVKAMHDGKRIAIQLSWEDSTKDESNVAIQNFSDGAAIQFSQDKNPPSFVMGDAQSAVTLWHWKAAWQADLAERKDIEHQYPHAAVDWYKSQTNYELGTRIEMSQMQTKFHDPKFMSGWGAGNPLSNPDKKSATEEAMAKGLGTLTTQMPRFEKVDAQGAWKNGRWFLVFSRELKSKDWNALKFKKGKAVNAAFAIWDGAHRDRNGQKMVSVWNELTLEA